jgi:hypothetical protein
MPLRTVTYLNSAANKIDKEQLADEIEIVGTASDDCTVPDLAAKLQPDLIISSSFPVLLHKEDSRTEPMTVTFEAHFNFAPND